MRRWVRWRRDPWVYFKRGGKQSVNYIYKNDQATVEISFKLNIPKFATTITLYKKSNYFILFFTIWLVLFKMFEI